MSCTGCNDGCFDESVQLAQGPAGSAGTAATNNLLTLSETTDVVTIGAAGATTIDLSYLRNVVAAGATEVTNATNAYSGGVAITQAIAANTLLNVGDILRLGFTIIGDLDAENSTSFYHYDISFGGTTIFDTDTTADQQWRLSKGYKIGYQGVNATLDFIVTAVNTLVPVLHTVCTQADRSTKMMAHWTGTTPHAPVYKTLSSFTPTLSNSNNLILRIKSSDGSSTVGLQQYSITKLRKTV